jgi:RNA polymerase primary sigma factor
MGRPELRTARKATMATTIRGARGLRLLLDATGGLARLSRDEERRLLALAQAGDVAARNQLVLHVLPLVIRLSRRYYRGGSALLEDLIQEGSLGLMRAVEGFDPRWGTRFSTYALWWVRAFLGKHVNGSGPVTAPPHGRSVLAYSLNENVPGDDSTTHLDRVRWVGPDPEDEVGARERCRTTRESLARLRHCLGALGWDVVQSRLQRDEPESLAAVGRRWGVSRECVRRAELETKRTLAAFLMPLVGGQAG